MADRKARTLVFKTPQNFTLGEIRDAIYIQTGPGTIEVVQELASGHYLVQLTSNQLAEEVIETSIDIKTCRTPCHPLHGFCTMVMGLRAYVNDQEVVAALVKYGSIKADVIRLKLQQKSRPSRPGE